MRYVRFSLLVERKIVWISRYREEAASLDMGERAFESQTFAIGVGVYTHWEGEGAVVIYG